MGMGKVLTGRASQPMCATAGIRAHGLALTPEVAAATCLNTGSVRASVACMWVGTNRVISKSVVSVVWGEPANAPSSSSKPRALPRLWA